MNTTVRDDPEDRPDTIAVPHFSGFRNQMEAVTYRNVLMGSPSGFMRTMYAASRARQTSDDPDPLAVRPVDLGVLPLEAPGLDGEPGAADEDEDTR